METVVGVCYHTGMYWLRRRIHPTWHLTAVALGIVMGTWSALIFHVNITMGLVVGSLLVILALWRQRRILLLAAFLGGSLMGAVRGSVSQASLIAYRPLFGHQVTMTATVADDADISASGAAHLHLTSVRYNGYHLPGQLFATVRVGEGVQRSDEVVIRGSMTQGFGSFAASMTGDILSLKRPVPGDVALGIRNGFAEAIHRAISEPEASLGIGYLLGQKSALPANLVEALKVAGLTHIVVASGYNLTILVRLSRRLFARISKYLAAISGLGLIIGFIAITGLSPSMTRAGLVAGLSLWAWYYGRRFHPVTLLGVAAATTVLINPSYVWGDIGWLLSFAAFAGVMIVAPVMSAYFFGGDKPPLVGQILMETIAAQIATAPILIMAFHQFSIIAPLSNLLVLPFIPLAMLLVSIAGIGGLLVPGIATVIGWPAQILLGGMVKVIEWCANIPWAQSQPNWQWWALVIYVLIVAGIVWYMKWRTKFNLYTTNLVQ